MHIPYKYFMYNAIKFEYVNTYVILYRIKKIAINDYQ